MGASFPQGVHLSLHLSWSSSRFLFSVVSILKDNLEGLGAPLLPLSLTRFITRVGNVLFPPHPCHVAQLFVTFPHLASWGPFLFSMDSDSSLVCKESNQSILANHKDRTRTGKQPFRPQARLQVMVHTLEDLGSESHCPSSHLVDFPLLFPWFPQLYNSPTLFLHFIVKPP